MSGEAVAGGELQNRDKEAGRMNGELDGVPKDKLKAPGPKHSAGSAGDGEHGDNIVFQKMPHELLKPAPPFLFVDRVESFDGQALTCCKQVGYNEPYLAGHFPGYPVVPGVLLIEMANQAGALLAIARRGAVFSEGYLARTGSFTFYHFARPGDCLCIRMEYKEQAGNFFTARALLTFLGEKKKAARGEVVLYLR